MAAENEDGMAVEDPDINADLNTEEAAARLEAEADALYDDVLTGSVDSESTLKKQEYSEEMKLAEVDGAGGNQFSVYIGNFTWWMSDRDLIVMAGRQGVNDIIKIKFAENRTNGQSKGYAKLVVSSEASLRRLLVSMPHCKINGEKVECRIVSQRTLAEFEAQARKRIPLRLTPKGDAVRAEPQSSPTSSPSDLQPPPLRFPPPILPFYNAPPPPFPPPPLYNTPPPPLFHVPPPHILIPNTHAPIAHVQQAYTPSLHINPAFLPHIPPHSSNNNNNRRVGDADFEELLNRNRTIASSAITKAMSAATSGDIRMAIETLYTATEVIKQSRVFSDKRCRMLVESLNDCLNSIETKCFPSSNKQHSQERVRSRSRDRYRERSSSTDRDRARERGRDREHRDRR